MSREDVNSKLMAVVERLNAAGDSWRWSGVEIASVAVRRWDSYARRHKKAKRVTAETRILDLAKGLQAHFEPDIPYTHPSDWHALANALAQELGTVSATRTFGGLGSRMSDRIDHECFIELLRDRFPEVATAIDDCSQGLLHLEMATLARATQAAIDNQDKTTLVRHFQFVDEVFRDAAPDVENAVNVSYLENLRFEGRKAGPTKARELLTPRLQRALIELEDYLARIHGS